MMKKILKLNEYNHRRHYRKILIAKRKLKNCKSRKRKLKDKLAHKEKEPRDLLMDLKNKKSDSMTIYAALDTRKMKEIRAGLRTKMIYHQQLCTCRADGECPKTLKKVLKTKKNTNLNTTENSMQKFLKRLKKS